MRTRFGVAGYNGTILKNGSSWSSARHTIGSPECGAKGWVNNVWACRKQEHREVNGSSVLYLQPGIALS